MQKDELSVAKVDEQHLLNHYDSLIHPDFVQCADEQLSKSVNVGARKQSKPRQPSLLRSKTSAMRNESSGARSQSIRSFLE